MKEEKKIEDAIKYLQPRNDLSDFDVNQIKRYPIEKMDFFISLVNETSSQPRKILQSRINKFIGVYDSLKNVVDT